MLERSVFFYIEENAVLISFSFLLFQPLNSNLPIFVFHFHWQIPFAGSSDTSCKVEVRFLCWINSKHCTTVTTLLRPCFYKNTEIHTILSCGTRFVKMHSFCFEGVEQMVILLITILNLFFYGLKAHIRQFRYISWFKSWVYFAHAFKKK